LFIPQVISPPDARGYRWGVSTTARVHSLNLSDGGVPKAPVREAAVGAAGLAGDRQRNRKYHGGPDRALCLYSAERIAALQAEGHPIEVGSTGENVTVAGLDWAVVVPGLRLALGAVGVEVTAFTTPCRTIGRSFAGGRTGRVSHRRHPGWSRVYARVLAPGVVRVGDPVRGLDEW
jgi:MOSC domain-containing protein YiiM